MTVESKVVAEVDHRQVLGNHYFHPRDQRCLTAKGSDFVENFSESKINKTPLH